MVWVYTHAPYFSFVAHSCSWVRKTYVLRWLDARPFTRSSEVLKAIQKVLRTKYGLRTKHGYKWVACDCGFVHFSRSTWSEKQFLPLWDSWKYKIKGRHCFFPTVFAILSSINKEGSFCSRDQNIWEQYVSCLQWPITCQWTQRIGTMAWAVCGSSVVAVVYS